jgi:hypothetical protein
MDSTRHAMGTPVRQRFGWTDALYVHTVSHMKPPSELELQQVRSASPTPVAGDVVVHWQSSFGLITMKSGMGRCSSTAKIVKPAEAPPL